METMPQTGTVRWLGLRPARRAAMEVVQQVRASPEHGLAGDRYGGRSGKRQVTLLQAEHVAAVAAMLRRPALDYALLRRNIVIAGLNLVALKGRRFRVGEAVLETTGLCHPCSRMEEALGPGGYNLMRGHGGITARVLAGGLIRVGDRAELLAGSEAAAAGLPA
ncbi:MAG: MOSC domain-containing protein [Gammaproteobacteria bacterium]|nr:MOSC domain-containing protein [Gammaproteobacteria bacterium]NNM01109.1 MOSC domain-containing protein [Gammaproteobacteria bacterium]